MLSSPVLQKTIAAFGEQLHIKEMRIKHETISNPDDNNLGEVLLSYGKDPEWAESSAGADSKICHCTSRRIAS